jgi:replicative DNA helicase
MTTRQFQLLPAGNGVANIEAEAALLGALMMENTLIDSAADIISERDFAEPVHGRIFAALLREHDLGHRSSPVTLRPYFADDDGITQLGGPGYLAQLTGSGAALLGTMDFAHQIADLGKRRRLIENLALLSRSAEDYSLDLDQIRADAETALDDTQGARSTVYTAAQCIELALNTMGDDEPPGISCKIIPSLDRVLGAIKPGFVVILAARPGMGKTATALSYAHGAAMQNHGVLIESLEMKAEELGGRMACDVAFSSGNPVSYALVTNGGAKPEQRRQIARAALLAQQWPLWIENLKNRTVSGLGAAIRRQKRRALAKGHTLKLVILDYLQLLQPDHREQNLYQATSAVSRGLKQLAQLEDVGILALCQLSRSVENRDNKRPTMADLRDSGQIEQDADTICFLLRQSEYILRDQPSEPGADWDEWHQTFEPEKNRIEFLVPKRRFGLAGSAFGEWHGEYQAVRG